MRRAAWLAALVLACSQGDDIPPPVVVDSTGLVVASSAVPSAAADSVVLPPLTLTDRMWALVELGNGSTPPAGAQGRQATLRLDASRMRVSGFAGCNRFSGDFRQSGDTLRFGSVGSTKMYCPDGEALERVVLSLLPRVTTWAIADGRLRLSGFGETLAIFAPAEVRGRSVTEVAY